MFSLLQLVGFLIVRGFSPKKPVWAFLSHVDMWGDVGGTQTYQQGLMRFLNAEGYDVVQVFPERRKRAFLFWRYHIWGYSVNLNQKRVLTCLPIAFLDCLFRFIPLVCIHVHHFYQWRRLDLKFLLNRFSTIPLITHFHDFGLACESLFLQLNKKDYCGRLETDFDLNTCQSCQFGQTLEDWQDTVRVLLKQSQRVFVPSAFLLQGLQMVYPDLVPWSNVTVLPHQQLIQSGNQPVYDHAKLRLAYLGLAHQNKGWDVFTALANDDTLQSRYDFYHLGGGKLAEENTPFWTHIPYDVRAQGDTAAVEALKLAEIDMVLLCSQVPESYSYTLFEAVSAGLPVLTGPNSGNIADQIHRGHVKGWVSADVSQLKIFLKDVETVKTVLIGSEPSPRFRAQHTFPSVLEALAPNVSVTLC